MNKKDINVTEATLASLSIANGDEIVDSQDNKYNVLYIDYFRESVVCGFDGTARIVSFDVIAGGEYQQVVGDQIVGYYVPIADVSPDTSPDIGYQRMPRESINVVKGTREGIKVVKATISLVVCDKIVDNRGKIFEVAYIDYARENIIAVSIGNIISGSRATVIRFDTIACGGYLKVVRQNLGAFAGINYPVTWLLWSHLIQSVGLHTY